MEFQLIGLTEESIFTFTYAGISIYELVICNPHSYSHIRSVESFLESINKNLEDNLIMQTKNLIVFEYDCETLSLHVSDHDISSKFIIPKCLAQNVITLYLDYLKSSI